MNIILIGFMGTGKSAVGQLLASELPANFLDTDELIEKTAGRKIKEIFRAEGEEYFRNLETEVLKTLGEYDGFVLATGGGIILKDENVKLLKELGRVVLLTATPEAIFERVKDEFHRPLLAVADPQQEIVKILHSRQPLYEKAADLSIDTSRLMPEQVKEEIIKWLK